MVLPAAGCSRTAPPWPAGKPAAAETRLWKKLWALPVACFWHEQQIEPFVVARYVRLSLTKPEHATVGQLERELGLTPVAMLRLRLVVEVPEPQAKLTADPYRHLRVAE